MNGLGFIANGAFQKASVALEQAGVIEPMSEQERRIRGLSAGDLLDNVTGFSAPGGRTPSSRPPSPSRAPLKNRSGALDDASRVRRTAPGASSANATAGGPAPDAAKGGAIELPALSASTREQFISNATQAGPGGASPIGQAIQSHASRRGSVFTSAAGSAAKNTALGRQFLHDLFASPGITVTHRVHKVHGRVTDVRLPSGAGAQFTSDGRFIGLLERYTPR
ncbi:MAG: hypothetical protein IPK74_28710 [Deltaproteobacteria bacterium]|nr:hypothetical protein [Deltaproteobacteria bacterium]